MNTARASVGPLQGQILRRTERREVAIFLLDGALWIADFIDGRGELIEAATWFRFNCAGTSVSQSERRMLVESAMPLSAELAAKIEMLVRSGDSASSRTDRPPTTTQVARRRVQRSTS